MLLTATELKKLNKTLDAARASTDECPTPYIGEDGNTYRLLPKPRARKLSLIAAIGAENVTEVNGVLHAKIPLGTHGRDHLGINPATGEVVCTLCKKK